MKKILQILALVGATLFAFDVAQAQTVSVTADLKSLFNAAQATKTQVCFSLTDGAGNQLSNPRTSGGVIVNTTPPCLSPDGAGHISTTVLANDQITPANSIYSVTYMYNGRALHGDIFQFLLADVTENLNTKPSLSTIPVIAAPTGDTTYGRLDGGNLPFTAAMNDTVGYRINGTAPAGHTLRGNGTNYVDAILALSDLSGTGTCAQEPALTGDVTSSAGSCVTLLPNIVSANTSTKVTFNTKGQVTAGTQAQLASADFANQGTVTTVLHGNAGGNPAFGSVVSTDLSITPTSCSNQLVSAISSTAAGTCTTVSSAMVDSSVITPTATQTLTNKRISPRVVTVTNATTLTPDGDNSDVSSQVNTQAGGTLTVAAPTGTPTDGQKLIIRVKSTNAQTYSFNATYRFSTTTVAPTTLAAGKTDYIGCFWNATDSKWDVVAVDQGR